MAEKKATREGFGAALAELGEKYDFLVLDADLAAATKTGVFKKKYPERFFDCGIAEGNMMGVAAGLAATGKKVFAASFAMFSAGRSFEQIRNSIGYPHLNVNIVGTHASITVGEDGATHQCSEDLALMRTIPGMTVICPADVTEAYAAVEAVINHDGPCYLRFGRYAVPNLTPEILPDYKFEIGKGVTYREGSDVTIIANGYMVHLAVEAADILSAEGISAEVINIHTIKPLDVANGEGIRVSLFVSGCTHHCPECFNSEAWDFNYGEPYTDEIEEKVLTLLGKPMIQGLSLLGGEPFEPQNQRALLPFLKKVRERYPKKTVWCYSGYTLEQLRGEQPSRARCEVTDEMLSLINVLVDGRFVEEKKNIRLRFRGSENQRLIDLDKTRERGEIVAWDDGETRYK